MKKKILIPVSVFILSLFINGCCEKKIVVEKKCPKLNTVHIGKYKDDNLTIEYEVVDEKNKNDNR